MAILVEIQNAPSIEVLRDTRDWHRRMFERLVPTQEPYLAGHYRGEDFECLRHRPVFIGRHEGTLAVAVPGAMEFFHADLIQAFEELEAARSVATGDERAKLDVRVIQLLARFMVLFLTYHPYANGNGHVGRLLLFTALSLFGLRPRQWSLNKRPSWDEAIKSYRNGNCKPLEKFMIKNIL